MRFLFLALLLLPLVGCFSDVETQTEIKIDDIKKVFYDEELHSEILEVVQLDNTTAVIAIFQLETGELGYSHLIKESGGEFMLENIAYEDELEPASYGIIETNEGKFVILFGENPNLSINEIWTTLLIEGNNYKYDTDVSTNEKFLKYKKISDDTEIEVSNVELAYSDKNNNKIEITK